MVRIRCFKRTKRDQSLDRLSLPHSMGADARIGTRFSPFVGGPPATSRRAIFVRPPRYFPDDPVADCAAHDQLEVAALEPRHLFGEHRHALLPRAWHAGDVGAPEAALRPEGLDNLLCVFVDVAIGVGLA